MVPSSFVKLVVQLESIKGVYECFGKFLELQLDHSLPLRVVSYPLPETSLELIVTSCLVKLLKQLWLSELLPLCDFEPLLKHL